MFFITGIIIAALFLVSTSMPLLSWVLPYYKIKKLEEADLKTKIIANMVAILAIGWVDIKFLIPYFGIYVAMEIGYLLFKKYGRNVPIFDRIFIIALAVGLLISVYIFFNRVHLNINLEQLKDLYSKRTDFSSYEINMAFSYIREHLFFLVFLYTGVTSFLTYYFLKKETFINWEVSYFWLVPYIILFFMKRYGNIDTNLVENGLQIFKIVYGLYFIKIVTKLLYTKIKKQPFCFMIATLLTIMSPEFAFIIGGLASGIKVRVKVSK